MTELHIKIVATVAFLAIICGCFFMLNKAESKITLPEPEKEEISVLLVTKPYPLNDWNCVENPGGYFFDEKHPEFAIKTEKEEPTFHNSAPIVSKPIVVPSIETTTEETTDERIEEDTSIVADPSDENITEPETTKPPTPQYIIKAQHYAVPAEEIYFTWPVREYTEEQKTLLAKMLYCEARGCSWDGQVATCSAIINHIEYNKGDFSVLDKSNHFSPASFYRYKTPNQMQYDVVNYVLNGHLIANVKYFRMSYYHNFGTPMFAIDGEYFSK